MIEGYSYSCAIIWIVGYLAGWMHYKAIYEYRSSVTGWGK